MININIERTKNNPKIFINGIEQELIDKEDFNFFYDFVNLPKLKEIRFVLPTTDLKEYEGAVYIKISEKND